MLRKHLIVKIDALEEKYADLKTRASPDGAAQTSVSVTAHIKSLAC